MTKDAHNPQIHLMKNISMKGILKTLAASIISAVVVVYFLCETVVVEGYSMQPSLNNNDWLLIDKTAYYLRKPSCNDIIVLKNPQNIKERYIKRVVALEGYRVKIMDNKLFINNSLVDEPYIVQGTMKDFNEVIVPSGHVFVLGDNRGNSIDSRDLGSVNSSLIDGRAVFRLFPIKQIGRIR